MGPDTAGLVASVTAAGTDARLIVAVGFIAVAVGFLLGMFLTWRGLLRRPTPAHQRPPPQP